MDSNAMEVLMDRFWVVKEEDRELFMQLRRGLPAAERFARDYPGWRLVNNEKLIRLEKLPSHAEPFMGIGEFTEQTDYAFFCALLIFLEDLEDGEAFLLSELVDRIEIQLKSFLEVDWTKFTLRKSLIRAMRLAESRHLIVVHEGNIDAFSSGTEQEVLYENTGLSRYFAVNFGKDISELSTWQDFETHTIQETDRDRGHFRINRVYRTLLSSPAMYWETAEDPDSLYLKNQRSWVSRYLTEALGGRLDIHRNAAFFVQEERESFGEVFPRDTTLHDMVLLVCASLRESVWDTGVFTRMPDDTVRLSREDFERFWETCAEEFGAAWSKEFREMPVERSFREVLLCMREWQMLKEDGSEIVLYPAAFKFMGSYPAGVNISALREDRGTGAELTESGKAQSGKDEPEMGEPGGNDGEGKKSKVDERRTSGKGNASRRRKESSRKREDPAEDGQLSLF